jgi:hypothetical protein
MKLRSLFVGIAVVASATHAQQVGPNVTVVNRSNNPVPITGEVTIQGGSGTSGDQTVTLHDAIIQVASSTFGNAQTPWIPVKNHKEVRLVVQRGSCSPCGDPVLVSVLVRGGGTGDGLTYQIDEFPISEAAAGIGFFGTRTYTTPGESIFVGMRNSATANNAVRVLIVGRSN